VLGSLSHAELESAARSRGFSLIRQIRTAAGVHAHMPSFGGAKYACMCGHEGDKPCPSAPVYAPKETHG
jgi:hypothetical protein